MFVLILNLSARYLRYFSELGMLKLICAKKQNTARDAPSGRSRAAEVHNLSERVSRIIVENFLSFRHAKKVFVEIHPFWTVVG